MIFIFVCNPCANSFILYTNEKISHNPCELIIPNYKNDWYVDKSSLIQNVKTNFPGLQHERTTIIETYNNPEDGAKDGPMDSAWPMQGHDVVHTCRSPYSTENNSGAEIWRVHGDKAGAMESSAIINNNGIIYFGTLGSDSSLYALYPNGTRKWSYMATGLIWCTPALAEDGTIYFGTWMSAYFHALNPDGTLKWLFGTGPANSPTIAEDGTIYIGSDNSIIWALTPNGTLKWSYDTDYTVMGCPAIGNDGTIYIGSGDHYLYALQPNGILRWRFATGSEIKGSASIAVDGTIYVPSFDGYLYALYPNGTMKWRASTGGSIAAAGTALDEDGTIYVGTEQLRAFYPNGTLKWSTDVQGSIYGTVPAVSADGTIYVSAGGSLVAVNSDGTERWRKQLTIAQIRSSPSIGPDDRVYVGSEDYGLSPYGYLHAFGLGPLRAEAGGPYIGAMTQPLQFTGEAFGGIPSYTYHWVFDDGYTSDELTPIHTYTQRGNYTATLTVTDNQGNQSQDTAQVTIGYPLPEISIVKPQNAVYLFNIKILPWRYPVVIGPIILKVEASQVEIGIDRVEFYDDGKLIKTDRLQPYNCFWRAHAPPILHPLMARVYDTLGNQNSITIYVNKWF
jgi:outer membrane protein assembly factor BamB